MDLQFNKRNLLSIRIIYRVRRGHKKIDPNLLLDLCTLLMAICAISQHPSMMDLVVN